MGKEGRGGDGRLRDRMPGTMRRGGLGGRGVRCRGNSIVCVCVNNREESERERDATVLRAVLQVQGMSARLSCQGEGAIRAGP